jgi:hypothetical protein
VAGDLVALRGQWPAILAEHFAGSLGEAVDTARSGQRFGAVPRPPRRAQEVRRADIASAAAVRRDEAGRDPELVIISITHCRGRSSQCHGSRARPEEDGLSRAWTDSVASANSFATTEPRASAVAV